MRTFRKSLPPGPLNLPVVGALLGVKDNLIDFLDKIHKTYGKIVYFKLGEKKFVSLCDVTILKRAMNMNSMNGRLNDPFIQDSVKEAGVLMAEGEIWRFHRRLSLRILKDLGMGQSGIEYSVQNEATLLCDQLANYAASKTPIDTRELFSLTTANVISSVVFGERPGYHDAEVQRCVRKLRYALQEMQFTLFLPILFPSLSILFRLLKNTKHMRAATEPAEDCYRMIERKLREHKHSIRFSNQSDVVFDENSCNTVCDDFMKQYLNEQSKHLDAKIDYSTPPLKHFSDWQITRTVFELYMAGTDTTAASLSWAVLLLSHHEKVYNKLRNEIIKIVPDGQIVTYGDRNSLPYTLAVIDEILRFSSVAPTASFHRVVENDVFLSDYYIPQNTIIIPNLYAIHRDPQIWTKPNEFYPEHFLESHLEDAQFPKSNRQYVYKSNPALMPFLCGKRACMGESLARLELFIFLVTLVQRFSFTGIYDCRNGESFEKAALGKSGGVRAVNDHRILFKSA
jgi:cytochrome P450